MRHFYFEILLEPIYISVAFFAGLSLEAWTLAWPILGPLMVAEKFPHQITQADIDVAYHVKDFYLHSQAEAGAVFTHENLKEAMEMITDSLFL